jgi:hypothetical protein
MRIADCEVINDHFSGDGAPEETPCYLAQSSDGALVEISQAALLLRDRPRAFQRFAAFRALAHPALPKLIAMVEEGMRMVVVTAHRPRTTFATVEQVQFGRAVDRLTAARGLALPLVCTVARAAAYVLADLHDKGLTHGRISPWSLAVDESGEVTLDAPRFLRAFATPRDDVDALCMTACALICASTLDDFTSRTDPPAHILQASREDVPQELVDIVAAATAQPRLDARALGDALAGELPWAQWTPQNVLDEMRALVPDAA